MSKVRRAILANSRLWGVAQRAEINTEREVPLDNGLFDIGYGDAALGGILRMYGPPAGDRQFQMALRSAMQGLIRRGFQN